ncbi:hypothetical protein EV401DRAFT_2027633 [Pisolithus croceorrhizus]|nr:hypothetical protein EV401DRAFT_2027633 [Pisolithus croceorrhizus]
MLQSSNGMLTYLHKGDRQPTAAESDPRTKPASIWLRKWSRNFTFSSFVRLQRANERLAVEGEIKSISQTLGADLLEHIRSAFCNACREHESSTEATGQVDHMKYDRQLDTPSMLQDIKTLQATFEATNDEGEQRALEEDITGKILWLFWCGICADVDELLPKVVDFIRKEEGVKQYLVEIPWAIASTEPVDDQMHLQRIMYDAGANTSKHQLWLEARAAEQAKWSGTNNGSPTIGDQGATPSTSRQTPSTPEV